MRQLIAFSHLSLIHSCVTDINEIKSLSLWELLTDTEKEETKQIISLNNRLTGMSSADPNRLTLKQEYIKLLSPYFPSKREAESVLPIEIRSIRAPTFAQHIKQSLANKYSESPKAVTSALEECAAHSCMFRLHYVSPVTAQVTPSMLFRTSMIKAIAKLLSESEEDYDSTLCHVIEIILFLREVPSTILLSSIIPIAHKHTERELIFQFLKARLLMTVDLNLYRHLVNEISKLEHGMPFDNLPVDKKKCMHDERYRSTLENQGADRINLEPRREINKVVYLFRNVNFYGTIYPSAFPNDCHIVDNQGNLSPEIQIYSNLMTATYRAIQKCNVEKLVKYKINEKLEVNDSNRELYRRILFSEISKNEVNLITAILIHFYRENFGPIETDEHTQQLIAEDIDLDEYCANVLFSSRASSHNTELRNESSLEMLRFIEAINPQYFISSIAIKLMLVQDCSFESFKAIVEENPEFIQTGGQPNLLWYFLYEENLNAFRVFPFLKSENILKFMFLCQNYPELIYETNHNDFSNFFSSSIFTQPQLWMPADSFLPNIGDYNLLDYLRNHSLYTVEEGNVHASEVKYKLIVEQAARELNKPVPVHPASIEAPYAATLQCAAKPCLVSVLNLLLYTTLAISPQYSPITSGFMISAFILGSTIPQFSFMQNIYAPKCTYPGKDSTNRGIRALAPWAILSLLRLIPNDTCSEKIKNGFYLVVLLRIAFYITSDVSVQLAKKSAVSQSLNDMHDYLRDLETTCADIDIATLAPYTPRFDTGIEQVIECLRADSLTSYDALKTLRLKTLKSLVILARQHRAGDISHEDFQIKSTAAITEFKQELETLSEHNIANIQYANVCDVFLTEFAQNDSPEEADSRAFTQ